MAKVVYPTADGNNVVLDLTRAESIQTDTLRVDQVEAFEAKRKAAQTRVVDGKPSPDRVMLDQLAQLEQMTVYTVVINGQAHKILSADSLEQLSGLKDPKDPPEHGSKK